MSVETFHRVGCHAKLLAEIDRLERQAWRDLRHWQAAAADPDSRDRSVPTMPGVQAASARARGYQDLIDASHDMVQLLARLRRIGMGRLS